MKNVLYFILGLLIIVVLLYFWARLNFEKQAKTNKTMINTVPVNSQKTFPPPYLTIDKNKKYFAVLKTDKGEIVIKLHAEKVPKTANNFIYLANNKFYDNTIFHRVLKGFMIQGGDPRGDGTGGPGYRFEDESFDGDYLRGIIAMANAGPNTNGSQFFIMHQDNFLPKNYVIFGEVTSGIDVVDKIAESSVIEQSIGGEKSKPEIPTVLEKVEIREEQK